MSAPAMTSTTRLQYVIKGKLDSFPAEVVAIVLIKEEVPGILHFLERSIARHTKSPARTHSELFASNRFPWC